MKKVAIFVLIFSSCLTFAQDKFLHFGVKAGLNYGDNGKIELRDVTDSGNNIIREGANNKTGYHLGVFLRANITDRFYIKPELQYTLNKSSYSIDNEELDYDIKKIDLPILAGISVLGPIHVFAGPSLQYIVKNELKNVELSNVKNEFTVGMQFGAGVQLGRFNADIRYEQGFSDNQAEVIDENFDSVRVDSRPSQFILSLGLDL